LYFKKSSEFSVSFFLFLATPLPEDWQLILKEIQKNIAQFMINDVYFEGKEEV